MADATHSSTFHPHVNGIRAVAILGVLFYHLNARYCPAGYFGVDVFLLISGYFLFRSLLNPAKITSFHYGRYLLGKSWRILPSWFVCAFIVLLASVFLMVPNDARFVFNTAATSSIFVANYYVDFFYDYFNPVAHLNALLHLWYLCIVVQMYIVAPLLVVPLMRRGKKTVAIGVIAVLSLLSLILYGLTTGSFLNADVKAHILSCVGAKTAYYHLVTRFWEFGAGFFICMLPALTSHLRLRNMLAIAGLTGIVSSFFLFKTQSPDSYIVVISTMLLMNYGDTGICSRILSWRPVQVLGTISFSLYLWHWPVMVFWKYYCFSSVHVWDEVGMVVISLLLSGIMWWCVEKRPVEAASARHVLARMSVVMLLPLMFLSGVITKFCVPADVAADGRVLEGVARAAGMHDAELMAHIYGALQKKRRYLLICITILKLSMW